MLDLVLTDYDMPNMTGFELVHAPRKDIATRECASVSTPGRDELYARIKDHVKATEVTGIRLKGIDHTVSAWVLEGFVS